MVPETRARVETFFFFYGILMLSIWFTTEEQSRKGHRRRPRHFRQHDGVQSGFFFAEQNTNVDLR